MHDWRAPLRSARRSLLTRCEWCGGPSRKDDVVNYSIGRDDDSGPWWRGERGLYHSDCSDYKIAHRTCVCDQPMTEHGGLYGACLLCGKDVSGRLGPNMLARCRLLASVPAGVRDPQVVAQVLRLASEAEE